MAGSDDDDSSDDDLFLTKAPTFGGTKRTQRGRDENRLLDFLDDCVEREETRLTSRRRMEDFERRSTKAVADDVPRDGDENGGAAASSSSPARDYTDADVDRVIRGTTAAERERRKRRLRDAADGLREGDDAPYAQDDDDEARRRRREARTADITGRSVGLGTRRTLGPRRKRTRRGNAAKALAAMVRRREDPWAARLRRAVDASLLPLFLRNKSLGRSLSSRDGASKDDDDDDESSSALPATVWEWLWDTATAGERCGTLLSEGACETLVDLLERGHAPPFRVEDLPRRFRRACGYAYEKDDDDEEDATKKDETEPPKRITRRRNAKKDEEKEKKEDEPTPSDEDDNVDVDPLVVRHCLLSWRAALARAPAATSNAEDVEESLETLLVASLDPCFVGGHGLTDSLQKLLLKLIERVRTSDDHDWTDATARRLVLGRVVPLLTTPNDDDGGDDSSPWLSLALLVRTVPFHDASGEVRGAALALAARVAEFALYHCVRGDADDVDLSADELWRRAGVPSLPRRRRQRRRLCALAAVGLDAVVRRRNDPPRLYATLVVAVACARFGNAAPGDDDDRAADAADLRTLEDACARAKKSITSVLVNEHFRRAKELLVWTASTLRFWRRELGANDDEDDDEKPTKVQCDLRGFATTTTTTTRDETET